MAKLTRFQIGEQSDDTFFDNSTGGIVPENHRIFNNDLNESFANLKDSNTFEGENTFQDTIQGDGGANFTDKVTMSAQFVQNQVAIPILATTNIDLTNIEGNIIQISNEFNIEIQSFSGNVGSIFYATFVEDFIINCMGGSTIVPPQNIAIKGGDTLIFIMTSISTIRIIGLRRYAGDFFQLNSIQDFQDLIDAQALQIGAYYLIPQGYDIWSTLWDIIFFAKTQNSFDANNVRVAADKGYYINVNHTEGDEYNALQPFVFPSYVNYSGEVNISNLLNDQVSDPRYDKGATPTLNDGYFFGDSRIDTNKLPILKNIQNLLDKAEPYFGRYLNSSISPFDPKFYPHSGTSLGGWGNVPYFEDGLTSENLLELNDGSLDLPANPSISEITDIKASYFVVNDIVTINFYVFCGGKMNQDPDGHSLYLYFPLPFQCDNKFTSSGHGVIRNDTDANFLDQGGIITYEPNFPEKYCIFSAKHNNTIGVAKDFMISGTFTYTSVISL
jgi:hypothetical protein